ncbi:hypothetical protein POM88_045858 [Heracleum sosnowskyi]|uniref:TF-B3 domain-containing protein n=1 Tax=Heracleum sosnowskyi TaxID=360622 RepID=A0AAD8M6F4_9APIA|nr:hypothetical protein POM88_045858 [Heracleum sosnowskyi]
MGKVHRHLTEKDLQGKSKPRDIFDSLVIAAQVARKIYIAEELQEEKQQRCSNTTIKFNIRDKRCSGEKSILLEGENCQDTTYICNEGFMKRSRMDVGSSSSQNSSVKVNNAKKKRKTNMINGPVQQTLKPEFLNRIQNMGGTDIKLVIEKDLFDSDIAQRENRFSIPLNQVREDAQDFLTEDEKNTLEKRTERNRVFTLEVPLIEPNLQMTVIKLRKWKMKKVYLYLLSGKWYQIARRNVLEEGNTMQVWSFRVQEQLHLALVNLSKDY